MSEAAGFYDEMVRRGIVAASQEVGIKHHGLRMFGFNVLVKPKAVEDKIGSIIIPDDHKDKLAYGVTEGELMALSPVAFTYETWPEGTRLPKVGDRVVFSKFVGAKIEGDDGIEYRVMEDKEILAVRS